VPGRWRLGLRLEPHRLDHRVIDAGLACLCGLVAFLFVCGPAILYPNNVTWLTDPDSATFLFGWRYFRAAPWSWPPGLNPDYGLSISSSIVYSDSVPLLAFLMKGLRSLVDVPQYAGIWLLTCFVLQALFGWLFIGLETADRMSRLLGATFLLFLPMFLWRLNGHYALCAHWLVLAGLIIALRPGRPHFTWWVSLLAVAALIQVYILVGLLPLFAAKLAQHCRGRWLYTAAEAAVTAATTSMVMWLAGYFAVQDGLMAMGYGFFHVNLLAPINPMGWSVMLPALPVGRGDYEGFIYLGAGGLLLGLAAIVGVCLRPALLRLLPAYGFVLLALAGLLAYAVTNRIGIGAQQFEVVRLPLTAEMAVNVFRASGRLCWPVVYAAMFACLVVVMRTLGQRRGNMLLASVLLLQIVDTSAGWRPLWAKLNPPVVAAPTQAETTFWTDARSMYDRVMLVPPGDAVPNWYQVARFASQHGLPTNAVYFGRLDHSRQNRARVQLEEELSSGRYGAGSLYVLNDQAAGLAVLAYDPATDLLADVDTLRVLAPGWKRIHPVPRGVKERTTDELIPTVKTCSDMLSFVNEASGRFRETLVRGWGAPETSGVWTTASVAELAFRLPTPSPDLIELVFHVAPYVPVAVRGQHVRVWVDGEVLAEWNFSHGRPEVRHVAVHRPRDASAIVRVRFDLPDAVSPVRLGISTDSRFLALLLSDVGIHAAGQCPDMASHLRDGPN
jgi:hypothetical protein